MKTRSELMGELFELALELDAKVSMSMTDTCVSVSLDNSFICTPDFNTKEENLQDCIDFLNDLKDGDYVAEDTDFIPCSICCNKDTEDCIQCVPF